MKRFVAIFVVLVALLSTGLYLGLRRQALETERPSGGSATLEGLEVGVVGRLAARIVAIHVDEGDGVEAGQVLVELDCTEPQAALAEATAAVNAATVGIELAQLGVELAEVGVDTAERQKTAAGAQAKATKSQKDVLKVQREAAARELKRVNELIAAGAGTEQAVDRAQSAIETLSQPENAVGSQVLAANAQREVVGMAVVGSSVQVRLAEAKVQATLQDLERAKSAHIRAQAMVAECTLKAPIGGIVQTRAYEPGEVAMPGTRLLTLVDTREVFATFYLPNAELAAAKPDAEVEVVADAYAGEVFKGSVSRVGTEAEFTPRNVQTRADRDRLVYAVEVRIPNADGRLRPGMAVEVTLPGTGKKD